MSQRTKLRLKKRSSYSHCTLRDMINLFQVKLWKVLILQGRKKFYLIERFFFYFYKIRTFSNLRENICFDHLVHLD